MKKLLFIDTETTGLKDPRLLQLGYAIGNHPPNVQIYRPPREIEKGAIDAHHISQEQADFYEPFTLVREQIRKLVKESIVIAHNLPYDARVLKNEGIQVEDGICTLKLSRRLYPAFKTHKLDYVIEQLGINVDMRNAHNAYTDVVAVRELFKREIMSIICKSPEKIKFIQRMIDITKGKVK
jgi:DNA polymerase-3 subunit epsilon